VSRFQEEVEEGQFKVERLNIGLGRLLGFGFVRGVSGQSHMTVRFRLSSVISRASGSPVPCLYL